jgi:hypothetical protein
VSTGTTGLAPRAQELCEAAGRLRALLSGFEPEEHTGAFCVALAEELALTEKACGAARLMAAARAVFCGAHKEAGFFDPARWMSTAAGTTRREAKEALSLAGSLEDCPSTKKALLAGEVSFAQGSEIAKAKRERIGEEDALLELARSFDLTRLRDEVRERRLSSVPVKDLHRRQLAARRLRHWKDGLGMVCFEGALPPETGIPLLSRIEREAKRRYKEAKRAGAPGRFEAYAADALVAISTAGGKGHPFHNDLVIVCDLYAWRRGWAKPGEPCHLLGGGPIPLEVAKQLAKDAFLKVVLHDGVDIQKVKHLGRRYTAELLTALNLGPVPAFSGRACVGCGARGFGLQFDHADPVAHHGETSIANLQDLCWSCHAEKTERDRKAGLLGKRAQARGPGPPKRRGPPPGKAPPGRRPPPPRKAPP